MGGQAADEEAWDGFAACMARTKSPGTSAPFREHLERDGERHIDRMNPFGRQDVDRRGHRRRHRRQPGRNGILCPQARPGPRDQSSDETHSGKRQDRQDFGKLRVAGITAVIGFIAAKSP